MTRPAWVILDGTKPIGIALSPEIMETWLDSHPSACAVRVPYPDVPYFDPDDDFDPDDLDPDEPDGYP
jgi:hypothetical protein